MLCDFYRINKLMLNIAAISHYHYCYHKIAFTVPSYKVIFKKKLIKTRISN